MRRWISMHNSPSSWMPPRRTQITITLRAHCFICIIIQKEQAASIILTHPRWMERQWRITITLLWLQIKRTTTTMNRNSVKAAAITAGINLVFYNNLVHHIQSYRILLIITITTTSTVTMQATITWICPTASAWVAQEWITTTITLDRHEMQAAITERVSMGYQTTQLPLLLLQVFHWVINSRLTYPIRLSLPYSYLITIISLVSPCHRSIRLQG